MMLFDLQYVLLAVARSIGRYMQDDKVVVINPLSRLRCTPILSF